MIESLYYMKTCSNAKRGRGLGAANVHFFGLSIANKKLWNIITKQGVWRDIIEHYINLGLFLIRILEA